MGAYINESEREENTRVRLDPRIDEIKRASKIKKTIEKLLPCVFCRIHFEFEQTLREAKMQERNRRRRLAPPRVHPLVISLLLFLAV
jgi:hypothetical protein